MADDPEFDEPSYLNLPGFLTLTKDDRDIAKRIWILDTYLSTEGGIIPNWRDHAADLLHFIDEGSVQKTEPAKPRGGIRALPSSRNE